MSRLAGGDRQRLQGSEHVRAALLVCGGCDMHVQFDISIDLVIRGLDAHLGTTRPAEAAGDFWATSSS